MNEPNASASGAPNGKRQLNVVFHGLWAWESRPNGGVLAHTPVDGHHVFKIGNFTNQDDLARSENPFKLTGVYPGTKNDFEEDQNVVVSDKPFMEHNLRHCVIELPPAREIHSLRRITVGTKPPFGGDDGSELDPEQVTMVQVFVYDMDNLASVKLGSITPPVVMNPDGQTANLHLFAQPPGGLHGNPNHAAQAYQKMALMFGLDIVPITELFTDAQGETGVAGLTADDLLFLGEPPSIMAAVSGSNCDGLVVDNRGSVAQSRGGSST